MQSLVDKVNGAGREPAHKRTSDDIGARLDF